MQNHKVASGSSGIDSPADEPPSDQLTDAECCDFTSCSSSPLKMTKKLMRYMSFGGGARKSSTNQQEINAVVNRPPEENKLSLKRLLVPISPSLDTSSDDELV